MALQVRQVVGHTWTPEVAIVGVRQVVGHTWTPDPFPLPNVTGAGGLLALLNAEAIVPFTAAELTIGVPAPSTSVPNTNTSVAVTAGAGIAYIGSAPFYYNRVLLNRAFSNTNWLLSPVAANTTLSALLSQINSAYGVSLVADDIVDGPVAEGGYMFLPGSTVTLRSAVPLSQALVNTALSGFDAASA